MSDSEKIAKSLIALMISVAAVVPLALLGGLVLSDLWSWFIVPVFGAPALTVSQAVGVSIVSWFFKSCLARSHELKKDDDDDVLDKTLTHVFTGLFFYLFVWGYAALWHAFA